MDKILLLAFLILTTSLGFPSEARKSQTPLFHKDFLIPAGKSLVLRYYKGKIVVEKDPLNLTDTSRKAISIAPKWLKIPLTDNLSRLNPDSQEKFAKLILNCPDKRFIDEVAFCIAHISTEVLENPSFDPSLIIENVRQIYESDKLLDFVQLVEKKDYTTTRYRLIKEGKIINYELPRDYYYCFIVHPQFFTEIPKKVNGYFWREYFLNRSEEGYPKLRDYMRGTKILWNCKPLGISHPDLENDENLKRSALARIGLWVMKQLPSQRALRGRPLQPIEVLLGHGGSCTENQAVLTAALRACLIPSAYARNFAENHEWVGFFMLNEWHSIQTDMGGASLHIDLPQGISYDKDFCGTKELSSVSLVRPDGYIIETVNQHSKTIKVEIQVVDGDGNPLDGIPVMVFTPYYPRTTGECDALATYGYTDINGKCQFTLGQNRDYLIAVSGNTFSIKNAEEGKFYKHKFTLNRGNGNLPMIKWTPLLGNGNEPRLMVECNPRSYVLYGKNLLPDFRRPEVRPVFTQIIPGGRLKVILCDKANYLKFREGKAFSAQVYDINSAKVILTPPILREKEFYLVFHNPLNTATVEAVISIQQKE